MKKVQIRAENGARVFGLHRRKLKVEAPTGWTIAGSPAKAAKGGVHRHGVQSAA